MRTYAVVVKHPGRDWEGDVRIDIVEAPDEIGPDEVRAWRMSQMLGPFQVVYVTEKLRSERLVFPNPKGA